jgi:hypothetical protein
MSALTALAISPFLAVGCGGSDTEAPGGGIKIEDYEQKFDDTLCGYLVKCGQMPDAASCKKYQAPDADVAQAVASVVFGDLGYDSNAAQACITAFQGSACETVYGYGLPKAVKDACDKVFTNKHPNGGTCFVGLECASGKCKPAASCADACCLGTCDDLGNDIPLDGMCGTGDKSCTTGTYCDKTTGKCTKLKDANESCGQENACLPGLACDVGGAGVCFQAAKSGSKCNPALKVDPCASTNEYCSPDTSNCVAAPQPGQPCTAAGGCARDGYCVGGTCKLLPIEGEDCGALPCLGSLKCSAQMNGKCLPVDGTPTCVPPQ